MKILAVDLGATRTGLALSDTGEVLATPVCTVHERDRRRLALKICEFVGEHEVEKIIVGLPINMDGTEGESARGARAFGSLLARLTGAEIIFVDERRTTVSAGYFLNELNVSRERYEAMIDSASAAVILQSYLDFQ